MLDGHTHLDNMSRASTSSDSSATERLKWRNHPPLISPNPEKSNPFEDLAHPMETNRSKASVKHEANENDRGSNAREKTEESANDIEGDKGVGAEMGGVEGEKEKEEVGVGGKKALGFRERIRHFTWTWFCMTMATGGIANVLYTRKWILSYRL